MGRFSVIGTQGAPKNVNLDLFNGTADPFNAVKVRHCLLFFLMWRPFGVSLEPALYLIVQCLCAHHSRRSHDLTG